MRFPLFLQFCAVLIGAFLVFSSSFANAADPAEGLWLTENERSVINVQECDEGLCGTIYWIIDGGMQVDEKNPDEAKRGQPMCGLKILWGFERDEPGEWENGNIYKADDGDLYSAELEVEEDGTLDVRGYLGFSFIGKSQTWTRVNAGDYQRCR